MTIEEKAKAYAEQTLAARLISDDVSIEHIENWKQARLFPAEYIEDAYLQGAKDANGWVRCADELPPKEKDGGRYSITVIVAVKTNHGYVTYGESYYDYDNKLWAAEEVGVYLFDVVAWIPIPEYNPTKE